MFERIKQKMGTAAAERCRRNISERTKQLISVANTAYKHIHESGGAINNDDVRAVVKLQKSLLTDMVLAHANGISLSQVKHEITDPELNSPAASYGAKLSFKHLFEEAAEAIGVSNPYEDYLQNTEPNMVDRESPAELAPLELDAPIEVMRVNLHMEYQPLTCTGVASVEWTPLGYWDPNLKPFLLALLYARILSTHEETRSKLFELVDIASKQNIRDDGRTGFQFPEWMLPIGPGLPSQRIWPWAIVESRDALNNPQLYRATLLAFPESKHWGIDLEMAIGQERVLAPASVLVAITSYAQAADTDGNYELAVLLWQINEFYGSPDGVRMGSETKALATATGAIRNGNLLVP